VRVPCGAKKADRGTARCIKLYENAAPHLAPLLQAGHAALLGNLPDTPAFWCPQESSNISRYVLPHDGTVAH